MENNTVETPLVTNPVPVSSPAAPGIVQQPTPKKSRIKFILPLIVVGLIILFIFVLNNNQSQNSSTQTSLLPTPTPVSNLATYKNPAGFSIIYPKEETNNGACNPDGSAKEIKSKHIILEDGNTVYISFPTVAVIKYKQDGDSTSGTTCTVQNVDINLQKNSWDKNHLGAERYTYSRINSDADLIALSESVFGKECATIGKQAITGKDGVFKIVPGNDEEKSGHGLVCYNDFESDFFYSETNKVAVVGNIWQVCTKSQVKVANGFGSGCGAQITFP
jgi:hypothetical protein